MRVLQFAKRSVVTVALVSVALTGCTGDPTSDTRSYKTVDDHKLELVLKKGGKVTTSGTVVVSADGKSRTVSTSGTDSTGKKFSNTSVYDKQ